MNLDQLSVLMKSYGMKALAERAGVSRSSLYNLLQGENFESETLEKVAKVLNVEFGLLNRTPDYEEVCNHLAYYGGPLFLDNSKPIRLSLEETIKWGLYFSKGDGLLESVMPYFLLKNFKKINLTKLLAYLDQEYLLQLLGYYLELAQNYSENRKMREFYSSFYRSDFLPLSLSSRKPSPRELKLLKSKVNPAAKRWNVLTMGAAQDYFARFRKWDKLVQ